jgi:hypothetical protein
MTTDSVASSTSNKNMNAHFHHHVISLSDARFAITLQNAPPTKHRSSQLQQIRVSFDGTGCHLSFYQRSNWFGIQEVKVSPRLSQKALSLPWHRMSLPLFFISSKRTCSHQHGRVISTPFYITFSFFLSNSIPENPPSRPLTSSLPTFPVCIII